MDISLVHTGENDHDVNKYSTTVPLSTQIKNDKATIHPNGMRQ